jgi:hypothetical protein
MALTKVIGAGLGSVSGVDLSSGNVTVVDGQGFYFGDGSYRIEGKDDGATTARIAFVAGGSEVARFTSSGLTFGGDTAAANALDDYEEGTFSVTIRDATSGGNTGSVSQNNKYVKIGDTVWMHFNLINITTTGLTGGNNLYFTGLPFTPATGSYGCGSIFLDRFNIDNNRYQVNIFQNTGQSYASVIQNADFGASSATGSTAVVSLFDNATADLFGTYMIKV